MDDHADLFEDAQVAGVLRSRDPFSEPPEDFRVTRALDHLVIEVPRRLDPAWVFHRQAVAWVGVGIVLLVVPIALIVVPVEILSAGTAAWISALLAIVLWVLIGRAGRWQQRRISGHTALTLTGERLSWEKGAVLLESVAAVSLDPQSGGLVLKTTEGAVALPPSMRFSELVWLRGVIVGQVQRRAAALGVTSPVKAQVPEALTKLLCQ